MICYITIIFIELARPVGHEAVNHSLFKYTQKIPVSYTTIYPNLREAEQIKVMFELPAPVMTSIPVANATGDYVRIHHVNLFWQSAQEHLLYLEPVVQNAN